MALPLPSTFACELVIKAGNRLEGCRDKGTTSTLTLVVQEGYDVLQARVEAIFDSNDDHERPDSIEIYIKPSNYATQKDYELLDRNVYMEKLQATWQKARLRKGGRTGFLVQLLVYVPKQKKQPTTTLHRAREARVQVNIPRMREAFESAGVDYGPASLRYAATVQARLPDDILPQIPVNQTFAQLQHIDLLDRQAPLPVPSDSLDGFVTVGIMVNGLCVPFSFRVSDIQQALGLPLYPLRPPYREPIIVEPPPAMDIEDIDHRESEGEENEEAESVAV